MQPEKDRIDHLSLMPLCHLKGHPIVRPRKDRIDHLSLLFEVDGYLKEKAKFICSLESPDCKIITISKGDMANWNKLWKKKHAQIEQQIRGTEWEFSSNKYLYRWDRNHRLAAWTKVIK